MTRPHPALIALGASCVLALMGLWSAVQSMGELQRRLQWTGETPSDDAAAAWALYDFAHVIVFPGLATAAAASALGIVLAVVLVRMLRPGVQSSSATRTMSAAGSTENLTESTVPNTSPSISNSWGSPSTTSSTERPRE